jgi:hypothetical protein
MLPAAGNRCYGDGSLGLRGYYGFYWSSAESPWYLLFASSSYTPMRYYDYRTYGFSVRCVAE